MLSKSSSIFKEIIFNKSEFLTDILVLNTRYKHFKYKNNNLFYLFTDQLNYILAYYFVTLETVKYNINKLTH